MAFRVGPWLDHGRMRVVAWVGELTAEGIGHGRWRGHKKGKEGYGVLHSCVQLHWMWGIA